ncbi:hypothetical protein, partial [Aneurinibacillus aneurinilyticus]|uniref:hypothetical protein n=1 Tax=Aneurinibacillus aneurinilyticus TaxID=1391 RepID=UPI002E1BE1E4|nr:hypothetical protein [Aneurinibacillus aneurinilyticus]
ATRSTQKNKGDARRTRHSFLSIYGYQGCGLSREEKTTTTGHKQGLSSPFPSGCPSQAKKDGNCLPLRVYLDVLRSRLAEAKSGPLCLGAGDEPTLLCQNIKCNLYT